MSNLSKAVVLLWAIIFAAVACSPKAEARVDYVPGIGHVSDICRAGAYWVRLPFQPIGTQCYIIDHSGFRWYGSYVHELQ